MKQHGIVMRIATAWAQTPVTFAILTATAVVFAVFSYQGKTESLQFLQFSQVFGKRALEIQHGQIWRLFTPVLLHLQFWHWFFNAVCFWQVSALLERHYRSAAVLAMVLLYGIGGNIAQYLATDLLFGGLSGVIFGMLGFIWALGFFHPRSAVYMPYPIAMIMMFYFCAGWLGWLGHIANIMHSVGLVAGIITGLFAAWIGKSRVVHPR